MKLNVAERHTAYTHEGGKAFPHFTPEQELRRAVMACLLWEDQFYESGISIAERISALAQQVPASTLAALAVEARGEFKLRHVPLLLCAELTKKGGRLTGDTIAEVIQRPDEITELLAIYWRNGKRPLSKQIKLGLARAFNKFDEYQFAKYNRDAAVKLRDAMFLVHPRPKDADQEALFKRIAEDTLATPDTWEVGLSGGGDKREVFTRLITEGRLGYLALLRNLRNMEQAGVDTALIRSAILARKGGAQRVLPFRYLMAAKMAPQFERELDIAAQAAIADLPEFPDETLLLVDVSGSMTATVSGKSQVTRMDAGAMLGALVRGNVRCFAFGTAVAEVPHRLGMAGVDVFKSPCVGHGTNIAGAIDFAQAKYPNANRIIVVTDMQSHDDVGEPRQKFAYMINVASYQNGVGYGHWTHIDGFSEATLRYIREIEGD